MKGGDAEYDASPLTGSGYELRGTITLDGWAGGATWISSDPVIIHVQAKKGDDVYDSSFTCLITQPLYIPVEEPGSYYIWAQADHWLGKASTGTYNTIPIGGVSINSGAIGTNSTSVTLTLSGTDYANNPVADMTIANNEEGLRVTWPDFAASSPWTLTSGEGTKTVYVVFRDGNELESKVIHDTIILDTTDPTPGTVYSPEYASDHPFTVAYHNASDSGSGLKEVRLYYKKNEGSWEDSELTDTSGSASGSFQFNPPNPSESATYYFDLVAVDNADNDTDPPTAGDGDWQTVYEAGLGLCEFEDVIEP